MPLSEDLRQFLDGYLTGKALKCWPGAEVFKFTNGNYTSFILRRPGTEDTPLNDDTRNATNRFREAHTNLLALMRVEFTRRQYV